MAELSWSCGWRLLRDITPNGFTRWRASQSLAAKTCNEYLGLTSAFLNWLVKAERIASNALATVTKAETRGRERRVRRALSIDELTKVIHASGERGLFYMLAAYTGLRRGEMKALVWSDLHLDESRPYVKARSSTTKNSKLSALPLLPELVALLKAYQAKEGRTTGKVFPAGVPRASTLRKDLAQCGIESVDELGRRVDIHALRKTFCTLLHLSGVSQRMAQEFMRHSEARLTNEVYTDATHLPLHSELNKIARPALLQTVPQNSGILGVKVSKTVQTTDSAISAENPDLSQLVLVCPSGESGGEGGIRTHGTVSGTPDFESGTIDHSATSPVANRGT